MGKRSGVAETSTDLTKLTLAQLNSEIERCLSGYENGGASQGRKSFFERLVWLEGEREKIHGVPAIKRRFGR